MSGQILDATLVAVPKQRNTNTEKADLRAGRNSQRMAGQIRSLATNRTSPSIGSSGSSENGKQRLPQPVMARD